ncbi:MAG: signal peptide peptidase SppA [Candidatus Diapherotrites archaeon]|nr:signal peptide peptidase SppA [Candidatus Diapherotrites archaeon]
MPAKKNSNGESLLKKIILGGIALIVFIVLITIILGIVLVFSLGNSESISGFPGQNTISVIPISGIIMAEPDAFGGVSVDLKKTIANLESAEKDSSVKAIVLEINSPGGSVVPTKEIVKKIREIEKTKPVVAHIYEVGASGGYYIAASANYVFAEEDAITGSIGVISESISIQGLLEKYGIDANLLTKGKLKGMGHPFKDLTEEEKSVFDSLLEEVFVSFKNDIKEFRTGKLDSEFEDIADGRILSGRQALKHGLIDATGSKQEAIDKAAELAGITQPNIKEYSATSDDFFTVFAKAGYSLGKGFRIGLTSNQNSSQLIQVNS